MAEFRVTSDAEALARHLHAAAEDLGDLGPVNSEAGRIVEAAARAPRRTGALAGSLRSAGTPGGVTIGSALRYATFVHWGAPRRHMAARPFLVTAVQATTEDVADLYLSHARDALDHNL